LHDNYSRPCKPLPKRCEIGNDGDLLLHGNQPTANVKPNWSLLAKGPSLLQNGDAGAGRKAGIVPTPRAKNLKSALTIQAPAYAHDDSRPYGRIREDDETNQVFTVGTNPAKVSDVLITGPSIGYGGGELV
jgi:hypothetical protein